MGRALAAVLIAALPACAADGGDGGKLQVGDGGKLQVGEAAAPAKTPEPPILVARDGPDTLEFRGRERLVYISSDGHPLMCSLTLAFESTEPDSLVSDRSTVVLRARKDSPSGVDQAAVSEVSDGVVRVDVDPRYYSLIGSDLEVDLSIFRVLGWKEFERPGLMDASLDEISCPPFVLRFAGEGESCWLSASMADDRHTKPGASDPSEVVSFHWVAENATVTDAKGRVLVRNAPNTYGVDTAVKELDSVTVSYSTHAKDAPPPEGEPTIQYPVTVRLRVPAKWRTEVKTFRFRGLPAPPSE